MGMMFGIWMDVHGAGTTIINDGGKADYPYYWTSTYAISKPNDAGAVRFDTKTLGTGEGEERVLNYIRLVREIK